MSKQIEDIILKEIQLGILKIDKHGHILRIKRKVWNPAQQRHTFKKINPRRCEAENSVGYMRVYIKIKGKTHWAFSHRIIYRHYKGEIPEGMQINHKDGFRKHNKRSNLEIVTPSGNQQHSRKKLKNSSKRISQGKFNRVNHLVNYHSYSPAMASEMTGVGATTCLSIRAGKHYLQKSS